MCEAVYQPQTSNEWILSINRLDVLICYLYLKRGWDVGTRKRGIQPPCNLLLVVLQATIQNLKPAILKMYTNSLYNQNPITFSCPLPIDKLRLATNFALRTIVQIAL